MSILHKFHSSNWGNGFQTNNAILDVTPYKPEVLILGTFNPDTTNNNADFFYGRNYFWPAIKNLFHFNSVQLNKTRMPRNGAALAPQLLNPTLGEIFELCTKVRLSFADLILKVLYNQNPEYIDLENDNVVYNNQQYNLIQDGRNNSAFGLAQLDGMGQVHWNTENIIGYLCDNPQIKQIYFTRQPTGIWAAHWNMILTHPCMKGRIMTNIFTPSGQGLMGTPRMNTLLHHWVHNIARGFGRLDNQWLLSHNITLTNF